MQHLIFGSGKTQSGFTNASTSASNDKDSSTIIREILQNSYDSAINEAGRNTAKIRFIIDYVNKSEIPGIMEYEEAISLIEKEDFSQKEQEQDILNAIKEKLSVERVPILYVIDNGVGFTQNKLVAILSDGISDKDNPNDASGSYGNGHFSAFNTSYFRYILYGGKFKDGSKLCSGQALLRTHMNKDDLKLGTGFLLTNDKPILIQNDIFYKNDNIPTIINDQLNTIDESGAVVGIVGFNFFGNDENIEKVIDIISSSIIRNFYVAIHENDLEVEIVANNKVSKINYETLDNLFIQTQSEKSNPIYNTAKQFYDMLNYGKSQEIQTKEGKVKLYYQLSDSSTKLAICRNGMWINDAIPSPLNQNNFQSNKAFNALVLAQRGTNFSTLIRRAESNSHDNIRLNRFTTDKAGKEKRKKLSEAFKEIYKFLSNMIEKNDNDSFEYDIPSLAINLVGDAKSKQQNKKKSTKTKKIPSKRRIIPDSEGESESYNPNPDPSPNSDPNPNHVNRKGKPFDVGRFNSFHNAKKHEAKLRFSVDKNASNLLLCLRMEDGTDPSCDKINITPRLNIKKAYNGSNKCRIIHNDTINIGKVKKNTRVDLIVHYETNIIGDYIIDYEFLNSVSKKDEK